MGNLLVSVLAAVSVGFGAILIGLFIAKVVKVIKNKRLVHQVFSQPVYSLLT